MTKYFLIFITIIGLLVRIYNLDSLPAILNRDEAALAYNALLLKQSGQDEWQKTWPLALESFGDYKLIGYPLILVGLFHFFEPSDLIVRLPSALAGTLLIPLSFYLGRRLSLSKPASLFLAFLVSLTGVFIYYSRIAFEANVALVAIILLLDLILNVTKTIWVNLAIGLVAIWGVITYNTPLIILPFLVPISIYIEGIKKWPHWLKTSLILIIIFILSLWYLAPLMSQKSSITIFSDESAWDAWIKFRQSLPLSLQSTLGSRYVYWAGMAGTNFGQSFSPDFLVLRGGEHPWHSLPDRGHIPLSVYGLSLMGVFLTIKKVFSVLMQKKLQIFSHVNHDLVILYLLIISLLPSIITVDSPHTTRSLLFIFMLLFMAVKAWEKIYDHQKFRRLSLVFVLIIFGEVGLYLNNYFTKFPQQQLAWQPGYDQIINEADQKYSDRDVGVIDSGGFQYILTAWYTKMSAEVYFSTNVRQQPDKIGFRYGERVGRFHFIVQPKDRSQEAALVLWDGQKWVIEP